MCMGCLLEGCGDLGSVHVIPASQLSSLLTYFESSPATFKQLNPAHSDHPDMFLEASPQLASVRRESVPGTSYLGVGLLGRY